MPGIAFVGDSFCASYGIDAWKNRWDPDLFQWDIPPTYIDRVVSHFNYTFHAFGFGGKSWWYSRQKFLENIEKFRDDLEVIVFCHTNPDRINNAWNEDLAVHHPSDSRESKVYYRSILDGDFNRWAQKNWFREISQEWGHLTLIHFHCFTETPAWSDLLTGVVFTTPLHHISIGEIVGDQKILDHTMRTDRRSNHLNDHNNMILGDIIIEEITNHRPGQKSLPLDRFHMPNKNSVNWPNEPYVTLV